MADGLMFLLPVTIDHTKESGARVPERFLAVQWLKVVGGVATPALETLARRLVSSAHAPHLPPSSTETRSASRANIDSPQQGGPPPMPAFPQLEDQNKIGHLFKFVAEVLWWVLHVGWMLFGRAPRWLRIILSIWAIGYLFSRLDNDNQNPPSPRENPTPNEVAEVGPTVETKIETLVRKAEEGKNSDALKVLAQLGS